MQDRRHAWIDRRQYLKGAAATGAIALGGLPVLAQAPAAYPRFKRGIGIHNLLNWPQTNKVDGQTRYEWPPFDAPDYRITTPQLRALASAGFDFIRLTVDPSIFIATPETRRPDLNRHARGVVMQLLDAGFNIVFDLHPVAVNPDYAPEILVASTSSAAFDAYADMVERVAHMLRDFPPHRVALELLNEPWISSTREARRWQGMLETLHMRARQAAPLLPLVIGGVQWNSIDGLLALDLEPFRSSNVLYTFHYYDPHAFTHQGVEGADTASLGGLRWPMNADNLKQVQAEAVSRINADANLDPKSKANAIVEIQHYITPLQKHLPGPNQIAQDFDQVGRWAVDRTINPDRILLGEFGCVASAQGTPLGADRLLWLQAVRTNAERAGFSWSFWAYKGYGGMQLLRDDGTFDTDTLQSLGLHSAG